MVRYLFSSWGIHLTMSFARSNQYRRCHRFRRATPLRRWIYLWTVVLDDCMLHGRLNGNQRHDYHGLHPDT